MKRRNIHNDETKNEEVFFPTSNAALTCVGTYEAMTLQTPRLYYDLGKDDDEDDYDTKDANTAEKEEFWVAGRSHNYFSV